MSAAGAPAITAALHLPGSPWSRRPRHLYWTPPHPANSSCLLATHSYPAAQPPTTHSHPAAQPPATHSHPAAQPPTTPAKGSFRSTTHSHTAAPRHPTPSSPGGPPTRCLPPRIQPEFLRGSHRREIPAVLWHLQNSLGTIHTIPETTAARRRPLVCPAVTIPNCFHRQWIPSPKTARRPPPSVRLR